LCFPLDIFLFFCFDSSSILDNTHHCRSLNEQAVVVHVLNMFAIGSRPLAWLQVLFLYFSIHFVPACMAQDGASSHDARATAQARNPDPSTTPTQSTSISSLPARTHTVEVGLADHKFRPDVTEAAIGDVCAPDISSYSFHYRRC
jgi:hypothetical protein